MHPRERLTNGEWLPAGEAARLLGVSRWSVMRWMRQGKLTYRQDHPGNNFRTINPDDLTALLTKREGR